MRYAAGLACCSVLIRNIRANQDQCLADLDHRAATEVYICLLCLDASALRVQNLMFRTTEYCSCDTSSATQQRKWIPGARTFRVNNKVSTSAGRSL